MKSYRYRAFLVFCFLFIAFLSVVGRAIQLQWRPSPKLVEFSESKSKWMSQRTQGDMLKSRGSILDANEKELALSLISKSFFANPRLIQKPKTVAYKLARYLKMPQEKLFDLLNEDRYFVWLKREVDEPTSRKIEDLDIHGIHFQKESKRVYPQGELAKTVLGFAGRDGRGLEGVEKTYDKWLVTADESGSSGIRDALGRTLLFQDFDKQWFEANDVVLSIDLRLQRIVEDELSSVLKKENAKSAQAIMINPKNGEIMAMASIDHDPESIFRNRTVSDAYEPGSTFKVITAMAAITKLHFTPDSQIFAENGVLRIGPNRVTEYGGKKYGWLSLQEMLVKSSNVAASKLALKLGSENLYSMIKTFDFGSPTGIDLPGEARGILRSASDWQPIDLANISFGQGISATPLQMARAYSAIANGGYLVEPHVVKRVQTSDDEKKILWTANPQKKEILDPNSVRELRRMLVHVTEPGGTGVAASVEPFEVAGKTGTAQKLVEEEMPNGKKKKFYSSTKSIVSFIGFVPAEDPAFVLYIMYDEAKYPASGGATAAPSFGRIAKRALGVLGVRPVSRVSSAKQAHSPKDSLFVGKSFSEVLAEIKSWDEEKQKEVHLIGYGKAIREEMDDSGVRIYFE